MKTRLQTEFALSRLEAFNDLIVSNSSSAARTNIAAVKNHEAGKVAVIGFGWCGDIHTGVLLNLPWSISCACAR
ncbi:MAG: hypothetical protein ABJG04_10225 [Roseobacter sp.]